MFIDNPHRLINIFNILILFSPKKPKNAASKFELISEINVCDWNWISDLDLAVRSVLP